MSDKKASVFKNVRPPAFYSICPDCKSKLTVREAVKRIYHLPEAKSTTALGHYDLNGNFEPDGAPIGSMDGAQTYDGDDHCSFCDFVVG